MGWCPVCDSRRPEAGAGSDPGLIEDKISGADPEALATQADYLAAMAQTPEARTLWVPPSREAMEWMEELTETFHGSRVPIGPEPGLTVEADCYDCPWRIDAKDGEVEDRARAFAKAHSQTLDALGAFHHVLLRIGEDVLR
jgi:pyruvate-formate lyase-activating enzyme